MSRIRACAYARVSTLLNQDPELQLVNIREYAKSRGYEIVEEYCDHGVSGIRESRPGLDRLIKDAKRKRFDVVIVSGIDRIGRSTRHLLNLIHELAECGVSLVSLREQIDLTTPMGAAVLAILAAIAQLERDLTRERIRSALAAKKLAAQQSGNGWRCGRPMIVDSAIENEISRLRNQGLSFRAISRKFEGRVSKTTVERVLRRNRRSKSES